MVFKQTMFTSWSFSRYSDYKLCPLKAKLAHLDKIREPKNAAMQRGADMHDQVRDYIRGTLKKLPAELKPAKVELDRVKKEFKKRLMGAIVEEDWAFTKDWTQTQWNDWANCVVRIKLDAAHFIDEEIMVVTDWKTGKFRAELNADYIEQLELYALAALLLHPHINVVIPRLFYLDLNISYPGAKDDEIQFNRADIPRLKRLWAKRTKPMLSDKIFAPRPNDKCRWCWYGQSKKREGGPGLCKF